MLPISEFQRAIAGYRKRVAAVMGLGIAGVFGCMGGLAYFRESLVSFGRDHFGQAAVEPMMGAAILPTIGVFIAMILLGEWWAMKDPRLSCPSCGKSITGMSALVTATRNCGFCGKRVLAEPESFE